MAKTEILMLNEEELIQCGVTDFARCVDVMEEMFKLIGEGDYVMGGPKHNSHGIAIRFPKESKFPNMPLDGPDRRFMAMPAYLGGRFNIAGCKWYGSNIAAYSLLPTGVVTIIHFLYPVIVAILCVFVFREKLSKHKLLCLVLCICGMLLMLDTSGQKLNAAGLIIAIASSFT